MVITHGDQVTPEWLTQRLSAGGVLRSGQVAAIECDLTSFNKGFLSNIATLKVAYSPDASGTLPQSLFLKMSRPDLHPELLSRGRHEVEFYRAVAETALDLPIPRCYDAEWDSATNRSHILMDDLSPTHVQKPLPIPPSHRHCEMIVESLAQVHAAWWSSPRLGTEIGERLNADKAAQMRRRLEDTLPQFMDYLGDALLPRQRRAYERILASSFLARLERRLCDLDRVSLIHGDAHTGNLMLPRDLGHGRVLLVDWHLWDINVPAIDLAFLIALHWSPERRAMLEERLLRCYHGQLVERGVVNYTWEDLWRDYRESVIVMALIPIGQFRRQSPAGVVWFGMQDSLAAFEDLHCAELL